MNSIAAERCLSTFLLSRNGQEQQEQNEQDCFFQYSATFLTAYLEEIWTEEMEAIPENTRFQEFFSGTRHAITSPSFDLWMQTVDIFHRHCRYGQYKLLSFVEVMNLPAKQHIWEGGVWSSYPHALDSCHFSIGL